MVVLDLDDEFIDRRNVARWTELLRVVGDAGPRTAIIDGDLLQLANPGLDESSFEVSAAAALEPLDGVVMALRRRCRLHVQGRGDEPIQNIGSGEAVGGTCMTSGQAKVYASVADRGVVVDLVVNEPEVPIGPTDLTFDIEAVLGSL